MPKKKIRAPKRIKGTRDVVVKVHACTWPGAQQNFFTEMSKRLKNLPCTSTMPSCAIRHNPQKYEFDVTCHISPTFKPAIIPEALETYALFLRPAHHASALYCQSCKAAQCLLSTDARYTHGPLTKLT